MIAQSQASFGRLVTLQAFGRATGTGANGPTLLSTDPTGKLFPSRFTDGRDGFRIHGKIDKVAAVTSATPNSVSIYIYNLGPDSRAYVSKINTLISVGAGYGNTAQEIFRGSVVWGRTTKNGPDYVTQLDAMDGVFAFQNARVDTSFGAGISKSSVINTLVGALKGAGIGAGQVQGLPTDGYNQGIVLSGRVTDQLRQICDANNLQFSIQDENVLILPYGSDRGTPIPLISPETGLIGIPEVRSAGASGGQIISFKCLMRPTLGLFQKVLIASKFVNGIYTTARVTHDFDSFQGPFFTEVECA